MLNGINKKKDNFGLTFKTPYDFTYTWNLKTVTAWKLTVARWLQEDEESGGRRENS